MKKVIIGLTGGIASGKTAVSDMFAEAGAYIVDADVISKNITANGSPILQKIEQAFPGTVQNGVLDRSALKRQAFATKESIEKLNAITHPEIFNRINNEIAKSTAEMVLLVVPLMFETGAERLCDAVITVSCPMEKRIERLIRRDNIDVELAKKIIARQAADSERESRSDYIVSNDADLSSLRKAVEDLYENIKQKFIC